MACLLRPSDGKMDVLGQVALQLGARPEQISDVGGVFSAGVNDLFTNAGFPPVEGGLANDPELRRCYYVNDHPKLDDGKRKALLQDFFRARGHELVFVE